MQENEQIIPAVKPPKWLYAIIIGLGLGIVGMILAIGYGLIFGFDKKTGANGEILQSVPVGKKYADFNIALTATQQIEQVDYQDYKIIVYIKDSENQESLIVVLSATAGNEIGRFVIGVPHKK